MITAEPSIKKNFGADIFRAAFPDSWYPVMRSNELKRGALAAVSIAGADRLVFRTKAGQVHVMDRHCAHMGASLAQGKVVGNCVECPFHRWRYDGSGSCVEIPYIEKSRIPRGAKVTSYPVQERFGTIYAFSKETASFELAPMPEYDDPEFTLDRSEIPIPIHQVAFMENAADYMHISQLHGARPERFVVDITEPEPRQIEYDFAMENMKYYDRIPLGNARVLSRFVSPNTNYGSLSHKGRVVARWVLSTLPIDANRTMVFADWLFRRLPLALKPLAPAFTKLAGAVFDYAVKTDIRYSWQDMRPDQRRVWVGEDRYIQKYHQFYRSFLQTTESSKTAEPLVQRVENAETTNLVST